MCFRQLRRPLHPFSYFQSTEALPDGLPTQSPTSEAFGSSSLPRNPVFLFLQGPSPAPGRAGGYCTGHRITCSPFQGRDSKAYWGSGILEQWSHWASTRWPEPGEGREGKCPWLPWGCSPPPWAGRSQSRGQGRTRAGPTAPLFDTSTV